MNGAVQKILSLFSRNKKIFLFGSLTGLFLLFFPGKPASAFFQTILNYIVGFTTAVAFPIPLGLLFIISAVAMGVSSLLAAFGGVVLNWVLSPSFIDWSYTNPATNQLINLGLNITKPLANMILVLVLVFIALATILRLAGYEVKKLLPTFIIVALLVNFSPVILGVMVDASNIVMNFFVSDITGAKHLISNYESLRDTLISGFTWEIFKSTKQIELLMTLWVFILINFALFMVLMVWSLVLMLRYIMIWILVILSPIAFVCFILPATKRIWDLWWNQFVQWLLIGVNLVFFLYLADQFAALNPQHAATGLGGAILPTITPLVVYYVGFTIALAKLPAEMGALKGMVKWAGLGAGAGIAVKAWQGTKNWAEEKYGIREKVGKVVHPIEKVPIARVFIPEAVRKYAEFRPAVDEAKQTASHYASPVLGDRMAAGADYGVQAVGDMLQFVERGDMEDYFSAFRRHYGVNTDEELDDIPEFRNKTARLLQIALRAGRHQELLRSDPRLAKYAFNNLPGYRENDLRGDGFPADRVGAVRKATSEARAQHIQKMEREVLQDHIIIDSFMERGEDTWRAIASSVKRAQPTAQRTIDTLFSEFADAERNSGRTYRNDDEAWEAYRNNFTANHDGREGFFIYAGTQAGARQGWRAGRYLTEEERRTPPPPPRGGGAPPTTPGTGPTTPGAAAGLGGQPRGPRGGPGPRRPRRPGTIDLGPEDYTVEPENTGRVVPPTERPRATYVPELPPSPPRGGARRRREPDVGDPGV